MQKYASAKVIVRCKSCGEPRYLSSRQARRAGLCRNCLFPTREIAVTDQHRRFWFSRFDDRELSLIVSELAGRLVPPDRIAERRFALTASSERVQSVGEGKQSGFLSRSPK